MPEFLELIETYRAGEVSVASLFGGEGRRIVSRSGPEYERKLAEATRFVADVWAGRRTARELLEAMTTSDFPYLFGDVLDRQMLAGYRTPEGPLHDWRDYCRVGQVPDFRTVNRFAMSGAQGYLEKVAMQEEYPESARNESRFQYTVAKYGRKFDVAWETLINDDLDALKDIPDVFAKAARNTEFRFFSNLWVANATLFSAGNGNKGTGALTVANLGVGVQSMMSQTDDDGNPILVTPRYLVVGPSLFVTAKNILNSISLTVGGGAGATPDYFPTYNWLKDAGLALKVNPWIEILDTSNGATSWYLFAEPGDVPAVEVGFLRGLQDPQIFIKDSNQSRVGGGPANPLDGDFDTDSIWYKVRHVLGGTTLDYRGAYWSDGTA